MKLFLFYLFIGIVFLLPACRSLSYFESPNNLRNIQGTLYLENGNAIEGKLVIETENLFGRPVKLFADEDRKPMQFALRDVKGYSVGNEHFELKQIKEGLSLGKSLYFMKRLTPVNSRMHLFEFLKKETVNKTAVKHEPEYYLQFPQEAENLVYASNGSRFVPHFEEKVSQLVQDCPQLAKKIANKQDGYFYAQVNLLKQKRAEVLLRIIREYNECTEANSKASTSPDK